MPPLLVFSSFWRRIERLGSVSALGLRMRLLRALWLGLTGACLILPAQAQVQALALEDLPPSAGGEQAHSAELAVSVWSRADVEAWWAALRSMEGTHATLPARLQPPADPAAWATVSLPDVRARTASAASARRILWDMDIKPHWRSIRCRLTQRRQLRTPGLAPAFTGQADLASLMLSRTWAIGTNAQTP